MRDVELYQQLLGLGSPWTVDRVELSVEGERVDVWAMHAPEVRRPCPECEALLPAYDHAQERTWRHLDSCQFKTYLHARVPRLSFWAQPDKLGRRSAGAGGVSTMIHRYTIAALAVAFGSAAMGQTPCRNPALIRVPPFPLPMGGSEAYTGTTVGTNRY